MFFLEITWLKSRSRKNASDTISSFAFRTPKRGTLEIITTDLKVQFSKARYLFLVLLDSLATNISSFDFELFGLNLTVEWHAEDASVAAWKGEQEVRTVSFVVVRAIGQSQCRKRLPLDWQGRWAVWLAINQRRVRIFQKCTFLDHN